MYDGHVLMNVVGEDGKKYVCLIDTGSPSSSCFHGGNVPLELMGEKIRLGTSSHGVEVEKIIEMLGRHIDYLLGYTVLKQFKMVIDTNKNIIQLRNNESVESKDHNVKLSFTKVMQVPVIHAFLIGSDNTRKKIKCFFDTGAKVSYVHSKLLSDPNYFQQKTAVLKKDFSPFIGKFDTTVYSTKIVLTSYQQQNTHQPKATSNETKELHWALGSLPSTLESMFFSNCDAVLGTDIFQHYSILEIDYTNSCLYLNKNQSPDNDNTKRI
eukprot:TRINITY_DN5158_c0_g1_i1.p1 TRINITY_DN5158_c0_g1~~TRINITY_DN5158_c0_g1_i1.p1  ORF type:complete len:277 (-),score=32.07 TRINITY_DN5158_c0_g1_i1:39-839(-)